MTRSQLTRMAVAFAAGVAAASLYLKTTTKPPLVESIAQVAAPTAVADDVAAVRADYERKLADLMTQLDAAKASAANAANALPRTGPQPKETFIRLEDFEKRRAAERAADQDEETAKFLAAGFSKERIDFIKKRASELKADFRRQSDLQLQQTGKTDIAAQAAHHYDEDIDLHHELGEEEYTRYRQAQGRSIGVKLAQALPGGTADTAGLKAGDEIVSYNGVRVFNQGELSVAKRNLNPGVTVAVEVVRDGRKFRVNLPAGSMSIQTVSPLSLLLGQ